MFNNLKKLNALRTEFGRLETKYLTEIADKKSNKEKEIYIIDGYLNQITELEKTKHSLQQDIINLDEKKRREDENIKHATKIILEKNEIEFEKKISKFEKEKDIAIAKVKDEYRDKREEQLDARGSEMKEMYTDVLAKLTSVTGTLSTPAVPVKEG